MHQSVVEHEKSSVMYHARGGNCLHQAVLYSLENIISLDPYGFHSNFFLYKNEFMSIATVHEKNT